MRSFFLAGALIVASAIDCTGVPPYRGGIYPVSQEQVHHDQKLYTNLWYVSEGVVPGTDEVWKYLGDCDQGTAGELVVDCTNLPPWQAITYIDSTTVKHDQFAWQSQWYANPDSVPGVDPNWVRKGLCSDGAGEVTVPVYTVPVQTTARLPTTRTPVVVTNPPVVVTNPPAVVVTSKAATTTTSKVSTTTPSKAWPTPVHAPFVDVTLTVQPDYTQVYNVSGQRYFMFSFITGNTACEPLWAGNTAKPISSGPYANIFNDIAKIRSFGGDIAISFGGEIGTELADLPACQSGNPVGNIKNAYLKVIDQYQLKWIDLDIESHAISSSNAATGWAYRFEAIREIQAERPDLTVSWTLPTLPTGLLNNALEFVEALLKSGVRLDILNVMNMNYGSWYSSGKQQSDLEVAAMDSVAQQVFTLAQKLNLLSTYQWSTTKDVYKHLGSTPMIGTNDLTIEKYSLADATKSMGVWQAGDRNIGFWGSWSLTRDHPCSGAGVSPICTSNNLQSIDYEFAKTMSPYTSKN